MFERREFYQIFSFWQIWKCSNNKTTVESINKDGVVLNIEKISHDGIGKKSIVLDKEGIVKTKECCEYYEFIIPTSINLGDSISDNIKIVRQHMLLKIKWDNHGLQQILLIRIPKSLTKKQALCFCMNIMIQRYYRWEKRQRLQILIFWCKI